MPSLWSRLDVRVSLLYLVGAALWIVASDALVAAISEGNAALGQALNTYKGLGFVLVTVTLLYALLRREQKLRLDKEHALEAQIKTTTAYLEQIRYQASLIESVSDAIISTDDQFVIRTWNKGAEAIYGWKADEAIGKPFTTLVRTTYLTDSVQGVLAQFRRDGEWRGEVIQPRRDGTPLHIMGSISAVHDPTGKVIGAVAINRDISERKRAEAALKDYSQQLQIVSARLVEAQETERRHIARELHDEIGQTLTALGLLLDLHDRQLPPDAAHRHLRDAQALVTDLMKRIRELSLKLRPSMLDDLGLIPTLMWYFERYEAQTGIAIDFRHSSVERRFKPIIETTLYRIIQEALTNVARHAQTDRAGVTVWASEEAVHAQVEDTGVGFDWDAVPANQTAGLLSMRERAQLVGGTCDIQTGVGEGTVVSVTIPLQSESEGKGLA